MNEQLWETEPRYHTFEAAGLRCVMERHEDWKHWCGYVGVGSAHPLYRVQYGDYVPAPASWKERPVDPDEHGPINLLITALEADQIPEGFAPLTSIITCHGGLTWSAPRWDYTGWWFGFDCSHAWDYMPGMPQELKGVNALLLGNRGVYRTFDYVKSECASLAQQIAEYANDGSAEQVHALIVALREARA
jgi:hypothetical protein